MHVTNIPAQDSNHGQWVHPLKEEVTRIQVRSYRRPDVLAQPAKGRGVVHAHLWMEFETEFSNTMIPGHFRHLPSKRNHSFQPLPLHQLHNVFCPSCHHPPETWPHTPRPPATAHAN